MEPRSVAGLDARAFELRYRELLAGLGREGENPGSVECKGCRGCQGCTFCVDSDRLSRCHYCVRCAACTDSSHCRASRALVSCHHCVDCESCVRSSYLVRSASLSDCTYCFGCVGLSGVDFHILNERVERAAYFEATARLSRELGLSR